MKFKFKFKKIISKKDYIELGEYKGRGRYGKVFKGTMFVKEKKKNSIYQNVAVKIFDVNDFESFKKELLIYTLKGMKHENILNFIKAEKKFSRITLRTEYFLVTEFKENGSLFQYLKINLLNLQQAIQICFDIAKGLAFLHGNGDEKRQIAHRDLKSSNILLNLNLKACIADFGLSLVFFNHELKNKNLSQVGTLRYMAPEVLDKSIHLTGDFLLKIDIYACALVFWEILTRCNENNFQAQEYKLPFEKELGLCPTIQEIQKTVSFQRYRPKLRQEWLEHDQLKLLSKTIQDCWNHDPECRLTALCICERFKTILNQENT